MFWKESICEMGITPIFCKKTVAVLPWKNRAVNDEKMTEIEKSGTKVAQIGHENDHF